MDEKAAEVASAAVKIYLKTDWKMGVNDLYSIRWRFQNLWDSIKVSVIDDHVKSSYQFLHSEGIYYLSL